MFVSELPQANVLEMQSSETDGNESLEKCSDEFSLNLIPAKKLLLLPETGKKHPHSSRPCENFVEPCVHQTKAIDSTQMISSEKMPVCNQSARLMIRFIRAYQRFISPVLPPACRFYPTCSEYGVQSIEMFGFFKGIWRTTRRLMRCHPFNPGGFDPVR